MSKLEERMNISTRIFFISLIILSLLSSVIISVSLLASSSEKTEISTIRQHNSHKLADQVRQTSNDLTRMARSYVMTGEPIYQQYFNSILAIRDGKAPRPLHYDESYWDFVAAHDGKPPIFGKPISLADLMKQARITADELEILATAKKHSDELIMMERAAFAALNGLSKDAAGKYTIISPPNAALAQDIMYSPAYYKTKAKVMRTVKEFSYLVNRRTLAEVTANRAEEVFYRKIAIFLTIATTLFSLGAFLYFRISFIKPVISLSNIAKRILAGNLNDRAIVGTKNEIGDLNDAFNKMVEARLRTERDLINNELRLSTTLNSIGDAMISTDLEGKIDRMNPVAEKLSGWKMEEAKGKPLTEIFNIINAKTRAPAINPVNMVLDRGEIVGLANHTILISKEGTEYQISDSAAPIRMDNGDTTGVVLIFRDVTKEYAAQELLHQSEERYKRLFENAEVSICNEDLSDVKNTLEKLREDGVTDIRHHLKDNDQLIWELASKIKITQVNNATLELFGAQDDHAYIYNLQETFGTNALDVFTDGLYAIWDKKPFFRAVADFRKLNGEHINAIISYPLPDSLEGFKCIPVSIIDITELKNSEIAHRKSEERLSSHLQHSPLGVISWDKELKCVQWNPAAEKIFGFTAEEAIGKYALDLMIPTKYQVGMSKIAHRLMQKTGGTHNIGRNVTKEGKTIICEWFNTALIDEDDTVIGIASMVQDITKHKAAEDDLRKLSMAVEQSPTSIIITNAHGIIEYANSKFSKTTGYSKEDVIGQYNKILRTEYTAKPEYENLWSTVTAGKQWQGEFNSKRKDGSLYWNSTSISPITDIDDNITNFLVAMEDITERRKIEEHLRRSQKMEAVGQLAGGIAHDFNNLLGIIIGNLDLMKRNIDDGSKLAEQLSKAQNAALRGSSLTRRLLNFSHQSPESSKPVNINKVIMGLEDLVDKSLTKKVTLETDLAEGLWMTALNTGDFEDALINFSLNARDAMPNGGTLHIATKNVTLSHLMMNGEAEFIAGDYVKIIISDTGVGMSKEVAAKAFDPFFTTKSTDKGTGLGLAMVYGFVQRSKGHILVFSEENMGTTFKIYLPRSQDIATPPKASNTIEGPLPTGSETILIVDDEQELACLAKNILDGLGYSTICAYSADQALKTLESNPAIDLLFSDIVMAGSHSGYDLAESAAQLYPKLKILLTSGFAGTQQMSDTQDFWGQKFITKPYRDVELAQRVRLALEE